MVAAKATRLCARFMIFLQNLRGRDYRLPRALQVKHQ
jgi:hypothetical protein